jgi:hypothetical protein
MEYLNIEIIFPEKATTINRTNTDTGKLVEDTKAIEITMLKELGKKPL